MCPWRRIIGDLKNRIVDCVHTYTYIGRRLVIPPSYHTHAHRPIYLWSFACSLKNHNPPKNRACRLRSNAPSLSSARSALAATASLLRWKGKGEVMGHGRGLSLSRSGSKEEGERRKWKWKRWLCVSATGLWGKEDRRGRRRNRSREREVIGQSMCKFVHEKQKRQKYHDDPAELFIFYLSHPTAKPRIYTQPIPSTI